MGWLGGWDHSLQAGCHVPVQIVNAHSYVYMLPVVPTTHTHPSTGTHVNPTHPKGHAKVLPAGLLSVLGLCGTFSCKGQLWGFLAP